MYLNFPKLRIFYPDILLIFLEWNYQTLTMGRVIDLDVRCPLLG